MADKKIYLTESQLNYIIEQEMLNESFNTLLNKVKMSVVSIAAAIAIINGLENVGEYRKAEMKEKIIEAAPQDDWEAIAKDVIVTVYNAVPSQCNKDVLHTASMFKLDLKHPESHKIIAMERTMMKEFGLQYGDIVKIEGTYKGAQDGIYQIQDTMNKRFAGQHKVDVLVRNELKYGGTLKDSPATIYVLRDKNKGDTYRLDMAPEYNGA